MFQFDLYLNLQQSFSFVNIETFSFLNEMSKAKALTPRLEEKRDIRLPGIWVAPRCIVGFTGIFNMAAKRDKVNKVLKLFSLLKS